MHIGITYDLRSEYLDAGYGEEETAEFDQSATIDAIEGALIKLGHTTDRIGHARQLVERLARDERWDLVFNICEGLQGPGREAQVPAILDVYNIPYTFADPAALVVCLDKALAKTVLRAARLPTPDWIVARDVADLQHFDLQYPVIAKPIAEGTGKGIDTGSKISDVTALASKCRQLLARYSQPVLIEEFLPGREFTVGILGTGTHAEIIGTLEIDLSRAAHSELYSYQNKEYGDDLVESRLVRPEADSAVAAAERIALAAWRSVGCRDCGRVDLRCNAAGRPQLIEINPLAGIHPTHSDLPQLWSALGREYVELIARILASAQQRITARDKAQGLRRLAVQQ